MLKEKPKQQESYKRTNTQILIMNCQNPWLTVLIMPHGCLKWPRGKESPQNQPDQRRIDSSIKEGFTCESDTFFYNNWTEL